MNLKKQKKIINILIDKSNISKYPFKMVNGNDIINYAKSFLGVPYAFGGTFPSCFDCSGFVQYVYKHFGINISRTIKT